MTEDEYYRILDHIDACQRQHNPWLSSLPKISHDKIWALISEEALLLPVGKPDDYSSISGLSEADIQKPKLAKQKLWEYISDNGPFVFEGGRCYFISVHQFGFDDWQHMRIPVVDVTDIAQKAFLSERKLQPERFVFQKNRITLGVLCAVALVIIYHLIRSFIAVL